MTRFDASALIESTDIVALIGQSVPLKRVGKDYVGLCPFHGERSPSFNVVPSKRMYYCHGCGATGDAIKWLREHDGLSFSEACLELGGSPQKRPEGWVAPKPQEMPKLLWGGQGVMRGLAGVLILDDKPDAAELTIAMASYPDHDIIWYPHGGATASQMELSCIAWEKITCKPIDGYWEELRVSDLLRLVEEYRAAHTKPAG